MISGDLLELLRCPATGQTLALADDEQVARINSRRLESERFSGALVRADGTTAYPVRDGIPVLLVDEAVVIS